MDLARLARWLRQRWVLVSVFLINLVGIGYGFYYYLPQFQATPMWLWPLVPDSPLAVLLMTVAIGLLLRGRGSRVWNLVGAAAMVKVGIWTAVVLVWFNDHFGFSFAVDDLNTHLWYLHLAMAAQALIIADRLPRSPKPYLVFGAAYVLVDVVDYVWPVDYLGRGCQGLFPHTLPCDHLGLTFLMTAGLTVASIGALYLLGRAAAGGPGPRPEG